MQEVDLQDVSERNTQLSIANSDMQRQLEEYEEVLWFNNSIRAEFSITRDKIRHVFSYNLAIYIFFLILLKCIRYWVILISDALQHISQKLKICIGQFDFW